MRRRRPVSPSRSLSDFDLHQQWGFAWNGWERLPSKVAFVRDYESVRDAFLAKWKTHRTPFAELALRFRDRFGEAALQSATWADIRSQDEEVPRP